MAQKIYKTAFDGRAVLSTTRVRRGLENADIDTFEKLRDFYLAGKVRSLRYIGKDCEKIIYEMLRKVYKNTPPPPIRRHLSQAHALLSECALSGKLPPTLATKIKEYLTAENVRLAGKPSRKDQP